MGITRTEKMRGRNLVQLAVGTAAMVAFPLVCHADYLYTGQNGSATESAYTDGGDWFNPGNWFFTTSSSMTVPPANTTTAININADTGWTPTADPNYQLDSQAVNDQLGSVQGAVYDPTTTSEAGVSASNTYAQLYVDSNSSSVSGDQPNLLTIENGSIELNKSSSPVIIGRDGFGAVTQTGGSWYTDVSVSVGANNTNVGNGVINYEGGLLQAGITSGGTASTASGSGIRLGTSTGATDDLGIMNIYNDGLTASKINLDNLYLGYASGDIGVLNFMYQNGGVKTINVTGGGTSGQGQFAIRNYAVSPKFGSGTDGTGGSIGGVLNLTLDQAPTLIDGSTPNIALVTYADGVHGNGTNDVDLFSPSGTDLTNGSTVSAVFDGTTYSWELEYEGSVSAVSSEIPSANISGTGGSNTGNGALVLVGLPVPEPTSVGVLVLGGIGMLARRRRGTITT